MIVPTVATDCESILGFMYPCQGNAVFVSMTARLGDNNGSCTSVRVTARPRSWIASSRKTKGSVHPVRAFDVRCAAGRLAGKIAGLAAVAMNGIRSTREEYAQRAFTNGRPRNVFLAPAGRHIPTGMRIKLRNGQYRQYKGSL
jgi:hypothetical protein